MGKPCVVLGMYGIRRREEENLGDTLLVRGRKKSTLGIWQRMNEMYGMLLGLSSTDANSRAKSSVCEWVEDRGKY